MALPATCALILSNQSNDSFSSFINPTVTIT
jgi:hypothetical protein